MEIAETRLTINSPTRTRADIVKPSLKDLDHFLLKAGQHNRYR
jgi:hypothetical protein